jgi:hypothetical protein
MVKKIPPPETCCEQENCQIPVTWLLLDECLTLFLQNGFQFPVFNYNLLTIKSSSFEVQLSTSGIQRNNGPKWVCRENTVWQCWVLPNIKLHTEQGNLGTCVITMKVSFFHTSWQFLLTELSKCTRTPQSKLIHRLASRKVLMVYWAFVIKKKRHVNLNIWPHP